MSLPKRIYELGREIANCDLVTQQNPTQENMTAFQNLLNQSWPVDTDEQAQRELVRGMYYSNPVGFMQYISTPRNRVRSLVLWTESKRIAKFFNLSGRVHISWDETTHSYNVVPHVPRAQREPQAQSDLTQPEDQQEEFKQVGRSRGPRQERLAAKAARAGKDTVDDDRRQPKTKRVKPASKAAKEPRQPRQPRPPREQREQREPREPRPPRQPRQPAAGTYAAAVVNGPTQAAQPQEVHVPTPIPSPSQKKSWADMSD